MARGRKPQPAALKQARGNPGKRPIAEAAAPPEPPPAKPVRFKPTARLSARGKKIWTALAEELVRLNFLRSTDLPAFERYCYELDRYWTIASKLKAKGQAREVYWTDSQHGRMMRINPWFAVQDRIARRLESMEDSFGLSPAARQRIMQQMAIAPSLFPPGAEAGADTPDEDSAGETQPQPGAGAIGMLTGTGSVH